MKQKRMLFVCFLLLALCGCARKDSPKFYCTEQLILSPDTGFSQRTVYTYDDLWRTQSVITYENEEEFARVSYEWNSDSTFCRITGTGGIPYTEDCAYTYDEAGNILKCVRTENGAMVSTEEYTYDGDGNVLSASTLTPGSTILTAYRYDSRGNCVETVTDPGDGQLLITQTVFDSKGRPLSEASDSHRKHYTYQDRENLTIIDNFVTAEGSEVPGGTTFLTRDEHGNVILQEHYTPDGELILQISSTFTPGN